MDEEVKDETVEAAVSAADHNSAADTAAATAPRELSINELEKLDDLFPVARDFNLHLHPARTRHHHILDLARAALGQGANVTAEGFLDQVGDSFGLLRYPELNFLPVPEDVYIPRAAMELYHLRPGQKLAGKLRLPRDREKGLVLDDVVTIEGEPAENWSEPTDFEKLTPQFPQGRIMLEMVDERPEEVTDLAREIDCQIYHSNFDENVQRHVQVAELVLERAKRLVEMKKDVVILLDSLTRLSRGYNNLQPSKGRIMSGGVEAKALTKPKKFFGSARNVEEGGSLTILATALTETGSRMDELIFEEFKGTGNMELHLDRALQEKRLYPAIHPMLSATRREDLLYHPEEWERVQLLRKAMAALPPIEAMEKLIDNLNATKTNAELLLSGLK